MKRRRVKITGIGPVTPAGIGREEFWKGILEPVSRVREVSPLLCGKFGPFVAAHIHNFNIRDYVDSSRLPKGSSRQTQLAVAAAVLALRDAAISIENLCSTSCAIFNGSALMDFGGIIASTDAFNAHGKRGLKPRHLGTTSTSSTPKAICDTLGFSAKTMSVQSECCGGIDTIGYASRMVADGEIEIALCGGTEAPLVRSPLLEMQAVDLTPSSAEMAERMDRPFDLWRTTGVVSEGACYFVIEPEESPRRGYSFITGYANANDVPGDLCGGLSAAIRMALADARMRPDQIECINAWGPGHKTIDSAECTALKNVFESLLDEIPVVSIKGAIGTPLAAAPAIQVAAAVLGQLNGLIPPTVNWEYPDPACPLRLSNQALAISHSSTLIDSHGLGGLNAALIVTRC